MRSSTPLDELTRRSSTATVPDSTLNSETWPTNWSATVLNTYASGLAPLSAVTSTATAASPVPAVTVVGRSAGDGPSSQMKSARRSTPTPVVGRAAQHGELQLVEQLVGERALELGRRRHVAGQVALELLVVARHDLLDQLVVQAVLLLGDVLGDRLGAVAAVRLVLEALVGQHVGDAVQALLLAERQLERHEPGPEALLQLGEDAVEVGARLVLLVDEDHARDAGGDAAGPRRLGADLDAVDRAHDEHGEIGDRQRGVEIAGEVGVARRVEEVDLVRLAVGGLPLERRHGERQRHRALQLLGLGVADRRAVLDPPRPRQHAGAQQQRLGERRLAGPAVADDGDVADLVGGRAVQIRTPQVVGVPRVRS